MFEPTSITDAEIDAFVDLMDRADIALAVHVGRIKRGDDPVRDVLETRAAILRWCADPMVSGIFGNECVRATAAAVSTMTPPEFLDYVRALDYLARSEAVRTRGVA